MYAKYSNTIDFSQSGWSQNKWRTQTKFESNKEKYRLKPYHHVQLDCEFKLDCETWLKFLTDADMQKIVCRPMTDFDDKSFPDIRFYSDVSKLATLGFGCILNDKWIFGQWPKDFIEQNDPSIEYLELFALVAGQYTWEKDLRNSRVTVFCDNVAVVHIVNKTSSSCGWCMKLVCMLVLNGLKFNCRVRAKYVGTKRNGIADSLSRLQLCRFQRLAPNMNPTPDKVSDSIWPITKLW